MQDLADRLWVHANLRKQEAVEVRTRCKIKKGPSFASVPPLPARGALPSDDATLT